MRVLIVSHATDLDGIASAALIMRLYPNASTLFADYTLKSMAYAAKRVASFHGLIFIADLNVNRAYRILWRDAIKNAKRNNCKIVWIDHHPWAKECESITQMCDIAVFGENRYYCAAELVARLLGFNDEKDKRLLKLVHASDFVVRNVKNAVLEQYSLALAYANTLAMPKRQSLLRKFAKAISKGKLANKEVRDLAKKFRLISKEEIRKALSKVYYAGSIAIAFAGNKLVFDDLLGALFEKTGKDIVVAVNVTDRKASIRSKKSNISRLAEALGGGGHPHAAGFGIGNIRLNSEADRERFVKKIERAYASVA